MTRERSLLRQDKNFEPERNLSLDSTLGLPNFGLFLPPNKVYLVVECGGMGG